MHRSPYSQTLVRSYTGCGVFFREFGARGGAGLRLGLLLDSSGRGFLRGHGGAGVLFFCCRFEREVIESERDFEPRRRCPSPSKRRRKKIEKKERRRIECRRQSPRNFTISGALSRSRPRTVSNGAIRYRKRTSKGGWNTKLYSRKRERESWSDVGAPTSRKKRRRQNPLASASSLLRVVSLP